MFPDQEPGGRGPTPPEEPPKLINFRKMAFCSICHVKIFEIGNLKSQLTMGWLRLVGSLKLQVSFAKEPYQRDDILQKRRIILRSLLIEATLYTI